MLYCANRETIRHKLIDSCFQDNDQSERTDNTSSRATKKSRASAETAAHRSKPKIDCYSVVRMGVAGKQECKSRETTNQTINRIGSQPPSVPVKGLHNTIANNSQEHVILPVNRLVKAQKINTQAQQHSIPINRQPLRLIEQNSSMSMSKRVMLRLGSKPKLQENKPQEQSTAKWMGLRQSNESQNRGFSRRKSGINLTLPSKELQTHTKDNNAFYSEFLLASCAQKCLESEGQSRRKLRLTQSINHRAFWDQVSTVSSAYVKTYVTEH